MKQSIIIISGKPCRIETVLLDWAENEFGGSPKLLKNFLKSHSKPAFDIKTY